MLDHMWSFRIGSMCWISGLLEQYNMYKQGWCNQRRAATPHTITSSEILSWCFEAAVLEAVVGGHMLNVTTVSRQPRATPLTHCHFSAMTDRRRNDRKNRAEKWRKSGIVRNCLRWLRSWGLGKSVEEREELQIKSNARQFVLFTWDLHLFWKWPASMILWCHIDKTSFEIM